MKERIMPFGKYKGEKVSDIIQHRNSYMDWILHNTQFKLTEEELHSFLERQSELAQKWLDAHRDDYYRGSGWESADDWESMAWDGAISPWGGDFM